MACTPSTSTAIPLRPELIEFMGVQALGRFACCSAALRCELRGAKAWQLLANAREPKSKREAALTAERAAAARVRSYELRRRLADRLSRTPVEPPPFRPNKFADFTYFVRFEEDGEVIWEGDLKGSLDEHGHFCLSLSEAWAAMSDSWDGMVEYLRNPVPPNFTTGGGPFYLHRLRITVIAMRDEDQAMVSLGHFVLDDHSTGGGDKGQLYFFRSRDPILVHRDFYLKPLVTLWVTHDETGGTVNCLELGVNQIARGGSSYQLLAYPPIFECEPHQIEFLLTFQAGIHHENRGDAVATLASWHDIAARKWGEMMDRF